MSTFLLPPADSEDLSVGVYYIHIVNSEPATSITTVSQLNITNAIGYVPFVLSGLTYTTLRWTFSNFIFPAYTYNTAPLGIALCKRIGISFSSSDPVIYYADLLNTLNQIVTLNTGKYTIAVNFPINGIIQFNQYYNYSVGPYTNTETIPKGLMYLLGTRNNTQSFLSPLNNAVLVTNSNAVGTQNYLFDRSVVNDSSSGNTWIGINFGSRRVKVGTIGLKSSVTQSQGWQIYGSNTTPDITTFNINNTSFWTLLGTTSNVIANTFVFGASTNQTYWKYLKLVPVTSAGYIDELEFYNSSMYSTDSDLMSTVIDSPFESHMNDLSGWGHTWIQTCAPSIDVNNSLRLTFADRLTLNTSPLFNLTDRNFKLNITGSVVSVIDSNSRGWLTFDGADQPVAIGYNNNKLSTAIGTSGAWNYLPNSLGNAVNSAYVGTLTPGVFDTLSTTRSGNTFTTFVNGTNVYSLNTNFSVGNAGNIQLGMNNSQAMNGNLKNVKLVT